MQKLLFATQNPNKIREIQSLLGNDFQLEGLDPVLFSVDIPETGATLQANAIQKATYVYEKTGVNCFADDTGLEVEALNGEPGVYTARYSGPEKDSLKNMEKLLNALDGKENRNAQFRTVIALIIDGETKCFEGIVKGVIAYQISGVAGFGYDPVFIPENNKVTFAEMTLESKNLISHRKRAFEKMTLSLTKKTD